MRIFEDVGEGRGIVRFRGKQLAACTDPRDYLEREVRLSGLVEPFDVYDGKCFEGFDGLIVQGKIGPQFDPGD